MGGDVYGDLLFLVNFSMDYLCAYLTASLLRRRAVPWRLLSASLLGGIYAVAALFLPLSHRTALAADIAVCVVMCAILFWESGAPLRFFGVACALFVGVSMAMGGMMTALFNLLNRLELPEGLMGEADDLSAWMFALVAGISTLAGLRGSHLLRRSAARRYARVTIILGDRQIELQALLDSGNLCRDPISGKAVIFIDPQAARTLIGEGEARDPEIARRFRLIPMETVSGRRLHKAYLPDYVILKDSSGAHTVEALISPAETLRGAGGYQAIVSAEMAL